MRDPEVKNTHPSAQRNNTAAPVSAAHKKPQPAVRPKTDDDDFSELEQRFSSHGRNKYYAKVSTGYRNIKLALIILLTAVVAFALVLGSDSFTYSNLRYLLRNFGEADSGDTEWASVVEFHGADGTVTGIYGGKLAVASGDSVSLFRMSGKRIYEIGTELTEPAMTCGGKYFFVWKCGEAEISVFNAISRVASFSADGPIYAVSADRQSSFAVLYKDRVNSSAVAVYGSDMHKKATKSMPQDNAVDIALSYDGGTLYTASFTAADGDYLAKLDFSDINSGTVAHTYTYSGEFPLKVGAFSDGGCYFVTDKAVYIYSREGETALVRSVSGSVYRIFAGDSYACVVESARGGSGVATVFSQSGEIAAEITTDGAVLDGCITGDGLFLLSSSVVLVTLDDGNKQLVGRSPNALGLLSDGEAVYCVYTGRAELIYLDGQPVNTAAPEQDAVNN